jgi:hypothetical protein
MQQEFQIHHRPRFHSGRWHQPSHQAEPLSQFNHNHRDRRIAKLLTGEM